MHVASELLSIAETGWPLPPDLRNPVLFRPVTVLQSDWLNRSLPPSSRRTWTPEGLLVDFDDIDDAVLMKMTFPSA